MEDWLYMMFIEKTKTYNKLTKAAVERHVANLRSLDEQGFATYKLKALQTAHKENNYLL